MNIFQNNGTLFMKICVNLFLAALSLSCSTWDPHCRAGVQFKAPELTGSVLKHIRLSVSKYMGSQFSQQG